MKTTGKRSQTQCAAIDQTILSDKDSTDTEYREAKSGSTAEKRGEKNGSGVLKNVEHKGVNNNVNKGGRRQLKDWIKDGGSKDVGSKDGGSKDEGKDGGNKGGKGKRSLERI